MYEPLVLIHWLFPGQTSWFSHSFISMITSDIDHTIKQLIIIGIHVYNNIIQCELFYVIIQSAQIDEEIPCSSYGITE